MVDATYIVICMQLTSLERLDIKSKSSEIERDGMWPSVD